jgi:Tfp pilus assembly protein PilP
VKPVRLLLILTLVAVPATAFAQIPVGTRVGTASANTGYDDGGRRDPFTSLVVKRTTGPSNSGLPTAKGNTLVTLSVADIKCTGVMKASGRYHSAIVSGPNSLSFLVKPQDRLLDGVVKSIDALGVVLIEHTTDSTGAVEGKEVRKLLHPAAEVIR